MNTANTVEQTSETPITGAQTTGVQAINQAINMSAMPEATLMEHQLSIPPTGNNSEPGQVATQPPQLQRQPLVADNLSANASAAYIYAAGNLFPYFPTVGLKEEYDSAVRVLNATTNQKVDPKDYYAVFSHKDSHGYEVYRYIAEQVSWILKIDNQDVYVLLPSANDELTEFIFTLKRDENTNLTDDMLSVVIGVQGPMAPRELCEGAPLPMVMCKHIYSFTSETMLKELSKNINTTSTYISNVLNSLLSKPNVGASDSDRARNFIAYRYSTIYIDTSSSQPSTPSSSEDNEYLESMEAQPSLASSDRRVIDLIFTYKKIVSGRTNSSFVSVDVTDQFPFLHSDLTVYIPTN